MTLNDAFHDLTIEQIEMALAVDGAHGFPQDVFGLARLMLRTFSVLDPGCIGSNDSMADPLETDRIVETRIADMLELERVMTDQFNETATIGDWHSDTCH